MAAPASLEVSPRRRSAPRPFSVVPAVSDRSPCLGLTERLVPGRCGGLKRDEIADHRQGLGKADPMEIACERENVALGV